MSIARFPTLLPLVLASCTTYTTSMGVGVEAQQLDGAWVFTYAEAPDMSFDALNTGEAAVVDGCLEVREYVVVWYDDQLDFVEQTLERIEDGEAPTVRVGGGGSSLEEGDTLDRFPDTVVEHCSPARMWYASRDEPSFTEP